MWRGYYVERADPDVEGYEEDSVSRKNLENRYKWANSLTSGFALDIPIGMGWGASFLTNAKKVIGVDYSREAIDRASSLYSDLLLITGDMTQIPLKGNIFHTIICCEGYEHIIREDQFKLIDELYRVISKNDLLLMTIPTKGHSTNNQFHLYEPTIKEVGESLINKFKVIFNEMLSDVAFFVLRPYKK